MAPMRRRGWGFELPHPLPTHSMQRRPVFSRASMCARARKKKNMITIHQKQNFGIKCNLKKPTIEHISKPVQQQESTIGFTNRLQLSSTTCHLGQPYPRPFLAIPFGHSSPSPLASLAGPLGVQCEGDKLARLLCGFADVLHSAGGTAGRLETIEGCGTHNK